MKLKDNIALSETGFVFNPVNGESFTINDTGIRVIDLLKQGMQSKEIAIQISSEYKMGFSGIEKDIDEFIDLLLHYQLMA